MKILNGPNYALYSGKTFNPSVARKPTPFKGNDTLRVSSPPPIPEDLKPFYNSKLISKPGIVRQTLTCLAGVAAMIGLTVGATLLFPPLGGVVGFVSALFITWYILGLNSPKYQHSDLRMTKEQAVRDAKYYNELQKYYRAQRWDSIKQFFTRPFKTK